MTSHAVPMRIKDCALRYNIRINPSIGKNGQFLEFRSCNCPKVPEPFCLPICEYSEDNRCGRCRQYRQGGESAGPLPMVNRDLFELSVRNWEKRRGKD